MNNLTLIDGDSIIYLSCYSKEGEKTLEEVLNTVDWYVNRILKQTNTEQYVGFLTDGSFRYKIAKIKEYKGNRKLLEKPKYFQDAKNYLLDKYKFIIEKDLEADDLCIMTHQTLKDKYDIVIASPDKDLKQIEADFYDYKKEERCFINEGEANYRLWKQVLTGDSGDNIPGLPNIGEIKANKILLNSKNDYSQIVLNEYINYYGEYQGIINFTENYQLVKMLDTEYNPQIQYMQIQSIDF